MPVYTEIMPATKTSPNNALRWSPAESDYSPIAGVLEIQTKRDCTRYVVEEFTPGWPGRAFVLTKITDEPAVGDRYDVFMCARGPEGDSCDCASGAYRPRAACRHRAAVRALLANRWL